MRARFLAALEAAEARAYGDRLTKLAASDVTIDKVDARPNGVSMVKAVLTQANGRTTRIEWEVHDNGRGARIADLKVAGISMSQIKRSEFNPTSRATAARSSPWSRNWKPAPPAEFAYPYQRCGRMSLLTVRSPNCQRRSVSCAVVR